MIDFETVRKWLSEAAGVVMSVDPVAVTRATEALSAVRAAGGTIFLAGNGGSASSVSHMALDLQKAGRSNGKVVRAISISDSTGLITAWANDETFERVFSEQLETLARRGDALVVMSVSGSSPNLLAALRAARRKELVTVGLFGMDGGSGRALVDNAIIVPSRDYGWVESAHLVLAHVMTYALRNEHVPTDAKASVSLSGPA